MNPEVKVDAEELAARKSALLILGGTFAVPTLITLIAAYYFLFFK